MSGLACEQCGHPIDASVRFCGNCGASHITVADTLNAGPAEAEAQRAAAHPISALAATRFGTTALPDTSRDGPKATVLGMTAPPDSGGAPPPSSAPASASVVTRLAGKATVLGMMAPRLPPADPSPPALAGPALAPVAKATGHKTMIGGSAAAPFSPAPAAADPAPQAGGAQRPRGTMLGVAMPGIAPTAPPESVPRPEVEPAAKEAPRRGVLTMPLQVAYVPPPAPLRQLQAPPPPVLVVKRGVPVATMAIVGAAVVVLGGGALAAFWKGAPPITAQARSAAGGGDSLHLTCAPTSCADGTTVALGSSKTTFSGGQADLTLPSPLHLGENDLELLIDRPGMGRDETMKFVVPVAYRVRADVTTMSAPRPVITVRVEAAPGSAVRVDDKPVTLDAKGTGAYVVDESAFTLGAADESRPVSLDLKYSVTPKGGPPETGTVSARIAVSPLRIDAPGPQATVEDDHIALAGRGPKGATVTVDGAPVVVSVDGAFEATVPLPAPGEHVIEARALTASLAPRRVQIVATRVASLADAARDFEQTGPIGYDAAMSDLAGKTGQPMVVEGAVLEARGAAHRTLVLVDDRRGCARGPCLARVVVSKDLTLARGDVLHAYGFVARAFTTAGGQTVPEVDSAFATRTTK